MIRVTRINGNKFFINAELVKSIESTPDTIIALVTGEKLMVKEKEEEVVKLIVEYKRSIYLFPQEQSKGA